MMWTKENRNINTQLWALACASLWLVVVSTSSGCAAVQSAAGAAMGPSMGIGGQSESVQKTFESFSYSDCKEARNNLKFCANTFMEKAGLLEPGSYRSGDTKVYNARAQMENLDPRWLPGWEKLPTGTSYYDAKKVYGAIATAAIRKNWAQDCTKRYKALHQETLAPSDAEVAAKIEEARKLPNLHERIGALTELRTRFESNPNGFSELLQHTLGGRYEVEMAILEELRAADMEVLFHEKFLGADSKITSKLRPRMSLEEETNSYCSRASRRGIDGMVAIDAASGSSFAARAYSKEQADAIMAKVTGLHGQREEAFALSAEATDQLEEIKHGSYPSFQAVDKNGEKVVATQIDKDDRQAVLGCKDLDKVERVRRDGTVEYKKKCRYADWVMTTKRRHHLPALPEGVDVTEDSSMEFIYRETDRSRDPAGSSNKVRDVTETIEREVLFVTSLDDNEYLHTEDN